VRFHLASDTRGATIVEFAIIIPVICTLMAAGFELGYRAYLGAIVQGALLEASRRATVGDKTGEQIDQIFKDRVGMLSNAANVKQIKKENFYNFTNVGKPEKITTDVAPIGVYNAATDCYEDANNNSAYDTNMNSGLGTADDIVRYSVTVEYPNIMPVNKVLGWGTKQTITASTVMRNQPFTSRAMPTIRCPS
jgi:Flp pilus assembly protein TadG